MRNLIYTFRKTAGRIPLVVFLYWRFIGAYRYLVGYKDFLGEFYAFRKAGGERFPSPRWKDRYVCLEDKTPTTGFDRHYVYHTAWAARILAGTRPPRHVDVSSLLYFSTIVSAFVPVEFYEYRLPKLKLKGLETKHADLYALPFADASVPSLSCMHVVEHVGLGRYGDSLDPDGDLKAMAELKRVLAVGGDLLFVVPVGKPRIMFNSHRIYSYGQVVNCFGGLELAGFALIPDGSEDGGLIEGATEEMSDAQSYGCGCFWFRKSARSVDERPGL
jgi:SAM-dependent methyltransferase